VAPRLARLDQVRPANAARRIRQAGEKMSNEPFRLASRFLLTNTSPASKTMADTRR
jgi:hypothetical protein